MTGPKVDDQRGRDLEAVCIYLDQAASADDDGRAWGAAGVALADLIAAARREGAAQGWDEGYKSGRARRYPTELPNPYRQERR